MDTFVESFMTTNMDRHRFLKTSVKDLELSALTSTTTTTTITYMPDKAELDAILQVAIEAANKAGVLIRDNIGARVKYSKTNYKV